jgi:hypothetical protein
MRNRIVVGLIGLLSLLDGIMKADPLGTAGYLIGSQYSAIEL